MEKILKVISNISIVFCVFFLVWVFASWIDIVTDNHLPNPQHSEYNAFTMLIENAEERG